MGKRLAARAGASVRLNMILCFAQVRCLRAFHRAVLYFPGAVDAGAKLHLDRSTEVENSRRVEEPSERRRPGRVQRAALPRMVAEEALGAAVLGGPERFEA